MKINTTTFEHKASAKDYFLALTSFPNYTRLINFKGKQYEKLVDYLLENEKHLMDDDTPGPSMKDLSQKFGIGATKISNYLKQIYGDILELNRQEPNLFVKEGQIPACLSFKYFGASQIFNIGLHAIPRPNDMFEFYFIKAKLGNSFYYVDRVYHDIQNDGHSMMISLSTWQRNNYLNLMKDKAYLNNQISMMEYMNDDNDKEMREKLVRRDRWL